MGKEIDNAIKTSFQAGRVAMAEEILQEITNIAVNEYKLEKYIDDFHISLRELRQIAERKINE